LGATLFHAIAGKPPIEASTNSSTHCSNQNDSRSIYRRRCRRSLSRLRRFCRE
jgi:hypothetical protein